MKKILALAAVAAIGLTTFAGAAAAFEEEVIPGGNCSQITGYENYLEVEIKENGEVVGRETSVDLKFNGNSVGSLELDDPSDGYITVILDSGYEVDLCLKGGNAAIEYTGVVDGDIVGPTPDGVPENANELSNIAWTVRGGPDDQDVESLLVTKEADGNYTRTHNWDVDKTVDPEFVNLFAPYWPNLDGSDEGSAKWTIDVDYLGYTDSLWNISGTITILNDGDLTASIQSVTDVLSAYTDTVEVTCEDGEGEIGFPYELGVGETLDCTYSVDVDDLLESENTATVTTSEDTYTDTVDVTWNDPTQVNETVTLTDDQNDDLDTDTFTAPTGGTVDYKADFTWDEEYDATQEDCGSRQIVNTASIFGDDAETALASDGATLDINVQCVEFNDETAWASKAAGQDKYNTRGGNWATWVTGASGTVNLYAGQTLLAGTVTQVRGVSNTTITVDLAPGFVFDSVSSNLKVQGYNSKPTGNPSPGGFANKKTCADSSDVCSITVPNANYYGIHADLVNIIPDPLFGTP
jgi:hypothetical protein